LPTETRALNASFTFMATGRSADASTSRRRPLVGLGAPGTKTTARPSASRFVTRPISSPGRSRQRSRTDLLEHGVPAAPVAEDLLQRLVERAQRGQAFEHPVDGRPEPAAEEGRDEEPDQIEARRGYDQAEAGEVERLVPEPRLRNGRLEVDDGQDEAADRQQRDEAGDELARDVAEEGVHRPQATAPGRGTPSRGRNFR
jgi:hypothetical protein